MRIADLASGNGLLSWALLVLDSSNTRSVLCVDKVKPPSACRITDIFLQTWPLLAARHRYVTGDLANLNPQEDALLVGVHCCGRLTDTVIELAVSANASLALVPCCHSLSASRFALSVAAHPKQQDALAHLERIAARFGQGAALDSARVATLRTLQYRVWYDYLPKDITPKNRMIFASCTTAKPSASSAAASSSSPPPSSSSSLSSASSSPSSTPSSAPRTPLWPQQVLPELPWSRFKVCADQDSSASQGTKKFFDNTSPMPIIADTQRILNWGSNQRRDSFHAIQALQRARPRLFCFSVPQGDKATLAAMERFTAEKLAAHALASTPGGARDAESEERAVVLDGRRFVGGEEGCAAKLQRAPAAVKLYAVIDIRPFTSMPSSVEQLTAVTASFDWGIAHDVLEEMERPPFASLSSVNVVCKKAHPSWRPFAPPQIEAAVRGGLDAWRRGQHAPVIRDSMDRDSAEVTSTGPNPDPRPEVWVWCTDAYMCTALRVTPNVKPRPP